MWNALMVASLMVDPPVGEFTSSAGSWSDDSSPQLQGPLSAAEVRAGLDAVGPQVERCYQALHAQYPDLVGTLEARFTVTEVGTTTEASAADAHFPVAWFQGCMVDALSDARFATAATPTTVAWTLTLEETALNPNGPGRLIGAMAVPSTPTESPVILGALDKSLIDAVMKRNMHKVRACYEQGLKDNPALAGKITVKFVIAKDGTVSKSETKATTMNNAEVEGCINKAFLKFEFPEPKGGGIVIVSYPFIFSPG